MEVVIFVFKVFMILFGIVFLLGAFKALNELSNNNKKVF
jgi:hypothetical protein